jgi:hypothetical protein
LQTSHASNLREENKHEDPNVCDDPICRNDVSQELLTEHAKKGRNIKDRISFVFRWIPKSLHKLDFKFLHVNPNPTRKCSKDFSALFPLKKLKNQH